MDMTGERRIEASRETVWQALNDPVVLKASIPGCESLEKLSDTDMKATASVKIGPIAMTGRQNDATPSRMSGRSSIGSTRNDNAKRIASAAVNCASLVPPSSLASQPVR